MLNASIGGWTTGETWHLLFRRARSTAALTSSRVVGIQRLWKSILCASKGAPKNQTAPNFRAFLGNFVERTSHQKNESCQAFVMLMQPVGLQLAPTLTFKRCIFFLYLQFSGWKSLLFFVTMFRANIPTHCYGERTNTTQVKNDFCKVASVGNRELNYNQGPDSLHYGNIATTDRYNWSWTGEEV